MDRQLTRKHNYASGTLHGGGIETSGTQITCWSFHGIHKPWAWGRSDLWFHGRTPRMTSASHLTVFWHHWQALLLSKCRQVSHTPLCLQIIHKTMQITLKLLTNNHLLFFIYKFRITGHVCIFNTTYRWRAKVFLTICCHLFTECHHFPIHFH